MHASKTSRLLRPYSPSKWYDCWKYRIQHGLQHHNKFYKSLNDSQTDQLHYWLSQCFMKIDMLLFDHDNHAMQLQWTHNEDQGNFPHFPHGTDSIQFVAKHNLPRALIVSTEKPIGYVNFKKYHDFIKHNNANLYSDLLQTELGTILEANSDINDDVTQNEHYQHIHPPQKYWTPKYDHIEGYDHPIWEIVDCIVEYLYRMSVYFHKHDHKLLLEDYDNMEISDRLIHYTAIQTFIHRYMHTFNDKQCPNPMTEVSENPPTRLCDKYPHIFPLFFSDIFRIIHLNGYINQSLYLRHVLGHGLYSISSFYDHSCDPNLVYATFKGQLRMVLVNEIKEKEPLTTSYLAEFIDQIDVNERRERLKWMGFDCKCKRCEKEMKQSTPQLREKEKQKDQDPVLPTVWSELRFFHHVLSEGIDARWQSRLFRMASFGSKDLLVKWFMKNKVKTGICEPSYECFHTLDVLCADAALNDILCTVALKKYRRKFYDRKTDDRELTISNM